MSEHERSTRVNVPAEAAFRVVSSLDSIPQFVPHIKEIREDHADEIFGVAEVDGRRWEFSGFFRVSPETRRIDWGSDGTPGYRGWMEMSSVGDQACEIRFTSRWIPRPQRCRPAGRVLPAIALNAVWMAC
jgi:hypothetical protein